MVCQVVSVYNGQFLSDAIINRLLAVCDISTVFDHCFQYNFSYLSHRLLPIIIGFRNSSTLSRIRRKDIHGICMCISLVNLVVKNKAFVTAMGLYVSSQLSATKGADGLSKLCSQRFSSCNIRLQNELRRVGTSVLCDI